MKSRFLSFVLIGGFLSACEIPNAENSCSLAAISTSPTRSKEVGLGVPDLGGTSVVQPLIPNSDGTARRVTVLLKRIGTFDTGTETITASIEGNTGNGKQLMKPNGISIGSSYSIDIASIPQTVSSITFRLINEISLSTSEIYWLRLRVSYPSNNSNYITWSAYDGTQEAYSVNGLTLPAFYETNQSVDSISNAAIGSHRFMIFNLGC
jgi:hypothetical protein